MFWNRIYIALIEMWRLGGFKQFGNPDAMPEAFREAPGPDIMRTLGRFVGRLFRC